ncbi:ORF987 [White spot syndrome virus]|uniref:ORF987 n=1 Tax=White spot syndrome virus TaxID=342409 RepID=A0A2D3I627_9VIRU|nr:ORF987 [White spot syndrome virus]
MTFSSGTVGSLRSRSFTNSRSCSSLVLVCLLDLLFFLEDVDELLSSKLGGSDLDFFVKGCCLSSSTSSSKHLLLVPIFDV